MGTPAESQSITASSNSLGPVEVRVYRFSGRQGLFTIPESWCRECDMFVRAVDQAAEQIDDPVDVTVLPWFVHMFGALRYGGYHPPVLVVDGERIAQGEDVPTVERVVEAIQAASQRRRGDRS